MIVALGADLKGSFALGRGSTTWHATGFGDLADAACFDRWSAAIDQALEGDVPDAIVVDRHPLYRSHHFGRILARRTGAALVPAQHHVAHAEAVRAEHGFERPYLGLILDGTGYGQDGAIWGCELLRIDEEGWTRAGRLRGIVCPGGDMAAREIWRMGLAWLAADAQELDHPEKFFSRVGLERLRAAMAQIRSGRPITTSAGRAFDAAAAIIGVRTEATEEGEAARALETLASEGWPVAALPYAMVDGVLDLAPAMRALAERTFEGVEPRILAAAFHETLIEGLVDLVRSAAERDERRIVLSGGCFLNAILSREIFARLSREGFTVHQPVSLSPGDDALALGQLAAARHDFRDRGTLI